ncbi:MAG: hypothetical protein ACXW1M_07435 [Acidimicrobiia bacterium]
MRVLCSCNALPGHVHPMLPLATALREDGHEVAFTSGTEIAAALDEAGFDLPAAGTIGARLGPRGARHERIGSTMRTDQ